MIRNVTMMKFKAGTGARQVADLTAALAVLRIDGMVSLVSGQDMGLRAGNWDYALIADLVDQAAYDRYDSNQEHNRIRRDLAGPILESIIRVQFEM
jgi:hypothetical protein